MSSPTREQKYASDEETSDDSPQQQAPQRQRRQQRSKSRQMQKRRQGQSGQDSGPLGNVTELGGLDSVGDTAQNTVGGVTNTLGNVAGGALGQQGGGGGGDKSDTLRLRLDLNLEIEITLKARIHGDLELALLN